MRLIFELPYLTVSVYHTDKRPTRLALKQIAQESGIIAVFRENVQLKNLSMINFTDRGGMVDEILIFYFIHNFGNSVALTTSAMVSMSTYLCSRDESY